MSPIDNSTYWANQSVNATMPMDAVVQTEPAIVPVATTFEPVVTTITTITPEPVAVPVAAAKSATKNLSAIIAYVSDIRTDIGKQTYAIGAQLTYMGFCEPIHLDEKKEPTDVPQTGLAILRAQCLGLEQEAERLVSILAVLLDQYPQV